MAWSSENPDLNEIYYTKGTAKEPEDIGIVDAILALKVMAGGTAGNISNARFDVNRNGKIDIADVVYMMQELAGLR